MLPEKVKWGIELSVEVDPKDPVDGCTEPKSFDDQRETTLALGELNSNFFGLGPAQETDPEMSVEAIPNRTKSDAEFLILLNGPLAKLGLIFRNITSIALTLDFIKKVPSNWFKRLFEWYA